MPIRVKMQPIQNALWNIYEHGKATKIGFGGPRGGTKSHSAMMVMLMRRWKHLGTNGLFIMRVYQDMLDIHIRPLLDTYPELEEYFNKQDMILKLPQAGGSYIRFLSGDNLETFQKRKGRGFADVMIDQSELFSKEEIEFLYTINRTVKPGITPKTLLCFNPGNVGHAYHKRVFYDKVFEENENPEDFAYLQAKGWDNAYWSLREMARLHNIQMEDLDDSKVKELVKTYHQLPDKERFEIFIKSDYGKNLNGLPHHKRRAELFGDMEIFEGMFFSDFRYSHHRIHKLQISPLRKTIAGLDYGNVTVLTVLQRDAEGTIVVAGECYLPDLTNPSDRANAIADYLIEKEIDRLEIIYDTDMEISQLSNIGVDKTPAAIFRDVFKQRMKEKAPVMRCVNKKSLDKNKPYRVVVNDSVKEFLKIRKTCLKCKKVFDDENKAETKCNECNLPLAQTSKLYISSEAKYLIKFLSEAIFDSSDPSGGDFDRSMIPKTDHPYDSFKYGFMELYTPRPKQKDPRPIWLRNIQREEKMKQTSPNFMGV